MSLWVGIIIFPWSLGLIPAVIVHGVLDGQRFSGGDLGGSPQPGANIKPLSSLHAGLENLHAGLIHLLRRCGLDDRWVEVADHDIVGEVPGGVPQIHFVANADVPGPAHGDLGPHGQIKILVTADVFENGRKAHFQQPLVQLQGVGQGEFFEDLG